MKLQSGERKYGKNSQERKRLPVISGMTMKTEDRRQSHMDMRKCGV